MFVGYHTSSGVSRSSFIHRDPELPRKHSTSTQTLVCLFSFAPLLCYNRSSARFATGQCYRQATNLPGQCLLRASLFFVHSSSWFSATDREHMHHLRAPHLLPWSSRGMHLSLCPYSNARPSLLCLYKPVGPLRNAYSLQRVIAHLLPCVNLLRTYLAPTANLHLHLHS